MKKDIKEIKKIAVIGAGLMGHGIAQVFAAQGYEVTLTDMASEQLSKAVGRIRSNLVLLTQKGIGCPGEIDSIMNRISLSTDLKEAVASVQFVVEAVSENMQIKQQVFEDLDKICPEDTILATNTSVYSITEIAERATHKGRIVGTHFWNPPYLIPLVEVVRGDQTDEDTVDCTFELMHTVGKHPVRVKKDVPGFVGNRLQHALWREAISIVEKGIADPETVDECIKYGFGLRLPVLGPMENADMVGTDLTLAVHEYILKHLEQSPEPSPLLKKKVETGELGFKSGRGFQEWPPEKVRQSETRLREHLLGIMK